MNLLIAGSLAYDTVQTPFGKRERALGGSAVYCGLASSHFAPTFLAGVVGKDFSEKDMSFLKNFNLNLEDIAKAEGDTFQWQGEYGYDLNEAHTLRTDLNVLADYHPTLSETAKNADFAFLANSDPLVQMEILDQLVNPTLVAADTMNYWIANARNDLLTLLKRVPLLVINEGECRMLAQEHNLFTAAHAILKMGPKYLVVKRGEYGVMLVHEEDIFLAPAFPLTRVLDPTGAGDTFAGGFMGHLASVGSIDDLSLRQAVVMGSVMASFTVEGFSVDQLAKADSKAIHSRFNAFQSLTQFSPLEEDHA